MNKDCDTIRDLMPLVLDDVASENSRSMVAKHVEGCKECREYMNQLMADLPSATAEEMRQQQQANLEAARMLRRKKRTRFMKALLLGVLIASIVYGIGLFAWSRMLSQTKALPIESYQLHLYQLENGNVYVTAELKDYKKSGFTVSEQYEGRLLYLSIQTQPYAPDSANPEQKVDVGEISMDDYDAICQGTPDDGRLVWQKGQTLPQASAWLELYCFWLNAGEHMADKMVDGDDGKAVYASVEDESRASWIQVQQNYYYVRVPEFAPLSVTRYTTRDNGADENMIRWILEGVPGIEENDILRLFELMNQVQNEMDHSST